MSARGRTALSPLTADSRHEPWRVDGCAAAEGGAARVRCRRERGRPTADVPGRRPRGTRGRRRRARRHRRTVPRHRASGHRPGAADHRPRGSRRPARRRRGRRAHGRHRARAGVAAPGDGPGRLGRDREQGAARRRRGHPLRSGRRRRGRPLLRGQRRGRDPAAAAAAREPGRRQRAPRARHRQRHDQLHPHQDGRDRGHVRRRPGGGAGPGLRRGRPHRRRRGPRRRREGSDPCGAGLPLARDPRRRLLRRHHRR